MNLLICGGRDFNDEALMVDTLNNLMAIGVIPHESEITIITGMAKGADMLAYELAEANDVSTIKMPANWKEFGKSAGYARNTEMLKKADYVLAFWDAKSKGTAHTIRTANKMGIPVTVIDY